MKIIALLNKQEGGCDYSSYFEKTWINNEKLHPEVKDVKLNVTYEVRKPIVQVVKDGDIIFEQVGNRINTAALQQFLLLELGLTGKQSADQ